MKQSHFFYEPCALRYCGSNHAERFVGCRLGIGRLCGALSRSDIVGCQQLTRGAYRSQLLVKRWESTRRGGSAMTTKTRLAAAFAAALGAALPLAGPAHAQGGVVVGTLSCNVASGFGFVFGSSRAMN